MDQVIMGRLEQGDDLYEAIQRYCLEKKIRHAWINALGAVSRLAFFYYDQDQKKYFSREVEQKLEILNCTGNVSLKQGAPFVHLHITCADREGRTVGGHLTPKSTVFACEVIFFVLKGEPFNRLPDAATGLELWQCPLV